MARKSASCSRMSIIRPAHAPNASHWRGVRWAGPHEPYQTVTNRLTAMPQKPSAQRVWPSHTLQVSAQCALLEEVSGVRPSHAVLVLANGLQQQVPFLLENQLLLGELLDTRLPKIRLHRPKLLIQQQQLRAAGNVLPDQLQFMRQVGFDSFEVSERFDASLWLKASRQMSLSYQRGFGRPAGETEVWSERHREAEPWLEQPHAG